jgi:hypothetical protein
VTSVEELIAHVLRNELQVQLHDDLPDRYLDWIDVDRLAHVLVTKLGLEAT